MQSLERGGSVLVASNLPPQMYTHQSIESIEWTNAHIHVTYGFVCFSSIDYETYVFHLSLFIYDNRYRAADFGCCFASWYRVSNCCFQIQYRNSNKIIEKEYEMCETNEKYTYKIHDRLMFSIILMWNIRISFADLHIKNLRFFPFVWGINTKD